MKKLLLFATLALSAQCIKAQVGIGTVTPDTSVILHIQSAKKGILLPQIENTETVDKREGSLIYNTETKKFKYYISPNWISVNPLNADANDNVTATGNVTVTQNLTVNGQRVDAPNATVTANTFIGNGTIPVGGIIMWSGKEIPEGWALCDGQNGTPDLRGRFIVGQSNNDTQNHGGYENSEKNNPDYLKACVAGGKNSVTLEPENMPAHRHKPGSLNISGGRHSHASNAPKKQEKRVGKNTGSGEAAQTHAAEDATISETPHSHPSSEFSGETGVAGGKYTYQTKINPPKLNAPEDCFNYKCTMINGDIIYSSLDLSHYQNISNYKVTTTSSQTQSGAFYDFLLQFHNKQGNVINPPDHILMPEDFIVKLSTPDGIIFENIYSCTKISPTKPYINPEHNSAYPAGFDIVIGEKWTTTPIDTRPAYYVLAFIMRVK